MSLITILIAWRDKWNRKETKWQPNSDKNLLNPSDKCKRLADSNRLKKTILRRCKLKKIIIRSDLNYFEAQMCKQSNKKDKSAMAANLQVAPPRYR